MRPYALILHISAFNIEKVSMMTSMSLFKEYLFIYFKKSPSEGEHFTQAGRNKRERTGRRLFAQHDAPTVHQRAENTRITITRLKYAVGHNHYQILCLRK